VREHYPLASSLTAVIPVIGAQKKPTWQNTRMKFATPVYFLTSYLAQPGCSLSSHPNVRHVSQSFTTETLPRKNLINHRTQSVQYNGIRCQSSPFGVKVE